MPHATNQWQDTNDGWDEPDQDDFVACPVCGEPVYEDAQRCPHCEHYITPGTAALGGRPLWFRIAWLLAGLILVYWLFGGLL